MESSLLIRGARQLVTLRGTTGPRHGAGMNELEIIDGGAMLAEGGYIVDVGPARRIENLARSRKVIEIDATGMVVLPGFVDSHTHLIHAAPRLDDYEMRLQGRSYSEIAAAGGGILSSVRTLRAASASKLEQQARQTLRAMASCGTTTVESKSGYGLEEAAELKNPAHLPVARWPSTGSGPHISGRARGSSGIRGASGRLRALAGAAHDAAGGVERPGAIRRRLLR